MARYDTFKYGDGTLYGSTPAPSVDLLWSFLIDWDSDGYYDGQNEAERAIGFSCKRGRENVIASGGNGFEHYQPGRVVFTLDNSDGRYNPYNTSSPLYPNVKPGRFARIKVKDVSSGTNYEVMRGIITDIRPYRQGGRDAVQIVIEDGLRWLANQSVKCNLVLTGELDVIANDHIIVEAGWPGVVGGG